MQKTQEMRVRFWGQKDPLEEETATHSSILAWRILWTEEPGGLGLVHEVTKSQTWLSTRTHINFSKYNINIIVKYIIYLPFLSVDPVSFIVFFPFNMESSLESGAAFSCHVFFNLIHFFSLPCFLKILTHLKNKICILFSPF